MRTVFPRLATAVSAITFVVCLGSANPALAIPPVGSLVPDTKVEDADGRLLDLRLAIGRPLLVMYEDKSSTRQNAAFKDDLARLASAERYRSAITLAAVADVAGYSFWPLKGFVKDAIRTESAKYGTTIYCDWDGGFRNAFNFRRGVSNLVLIDRGGKVVYAHEGALTNEERAQLLDLLRVAAGVT